MKKSLKLAVLTVLTISTTSLLATNGSTLIGIGAKSRGMGGTAIGIGHGAESAIPNPALITTIKSDNEVSFGGTIFMPDIDTDGFGGGFSESKSDFFVIPSVSLASKVNDNFYMGVGMWGTGGLGVDYRQSALNGTNMDMVTALQTMQFGVPMAYTSNGFSVGIIPIVQYSSLDIQYDGNTSNPAGGDVGAGVAQDVAFGFNFGVAYEQDGITLGASYKSKIKFKIDDVLTNALDGMGPAVPGNGGLDKMATPEEYGLGISYTTDGHTIALDYKYINWEDAEGYKDFGWEDQDVIAIGYEYATDKWSVRCGYKYAESAVKDNSGKNLYLDSNLAGITNTFNLIGFPGTQESHITFGGSYVFNETLSMDLAAVYGLENTETFTNFQGGDTTVDHSEQSYSIQFNYAF